ncbi:MAG: GtrA family protein [Prolixibacteraceae bacterium]|jgi:putative flippase GtrA|nr:GtrA family protein [Prolixibacteraceae bacterium]
MLNFSRKIRDLIIAVIDWFYTPFKNLIPQETFRYAATGGMNTTFDILLYFVFYNFIINKQVVNLGIIAMSPHIAAFAFVFPITFGTGFLLAKYVTFTQSLLRGKTQLFRYGISVGGSILLNYLLLKFFVEVIGWYATVSKIATTIIVILYSYMVQRHFTFRTSKRAIAKAESRM